MERFKEGCIHKGGNKKMKYDRMVDINRKKSESNVQIVKQEIQRMLDRKEKVTVTALERYTGFSYSFFYKNEKVKNAIKAAQLEQGECYNPKKVIFDMALESKVESLKTSIWKLKRQNKDLTNENQKLKEDLRKAQEEIQELRERS